MVLADPAETHADGHCPGEASEASRPPTEPGGSPSLAAFPRDSQGSAPSVDYSPSQCSCSSFSSYDDYSEDFVSESSETAVSRKHLEAPVIKGKKEKKNYVSKVLKPKVNRWPCYRAPQYLDFPGFFPFISAEEYHFALAMNYTFLSQQPKKMVSNSGQKEISAEKKHNWNSITNVTTQRRDSETHHILSAKLHKIKELKNEITDIHRKLEATAVENQYLKQLQVRHLKAIGKYETSQNNMPQIMVKHQNEVKNLRQLLRKSKEKERTVSRKLREMNGELLKTKDALQALQILAEDKSLLEREELTQRLASLTTKMEANDQKIQSLEQQLRLNTKAFRRQMAVENQKQLAAQKAKETLQMEIKDLQQKLKEKKRELEIKNIYANRILKNLHDKDDYPKVSSTKSVQDVRTSVSFTSMRHQETQIPEDIPSLMAKVKKTTGNADHKEKPTEIVRVIPHYINKLPSQEDSNRKYEDLSKEEEHFKVQVALENVGRQREKKAAQEKKTTLEKEPAPPPPARIPAVHPEGEGQRADPREDQQEDPGEDPAAKEAGKKALQISDLDEALNKTAAPNTKLLLRPRKHYSFTEATENLHQGLPAAGGPAHLGAGRGRPAAGRRGAAGARKPEPPAGADQPPFGRPPGPKAKDAAFREKKSSLMKELFGSGSVFTDAQAGAAGAAGAGSAESWSAERPPPGQPPARSAFGDSSAAPVRSL